MATDHDSGDGPGRVEVGPQVQTDALYRQDVPTAGTAAEDPTSNVTLDPMSTATAHAPQVESGQDPRLTAGWRTSTVFLAILLPTTAVGFADMWFHREFTYWTGAVFIIMCLVAAIKVRPVDLWTSVISPPIAYLLALLIAGQPTTFPGGGSLLIREASLLATGLAFNAPYIYGGTLVAFVVVLFRRRKVRALASQ